MIKQKIEITNASLTVTLVKRKGYYEFKEVLTEYAFDTKDDAILELRKVFGQNVNIKFK